MFVFNILNANPTANGIADIFEINHGDTELLLKHLKAITNIMNKAIKELETSLNITIFQRTSTGVIPTVQGQEFLDSARQILQQIAELEAHKDDIN